MTRAKRTVSWSLGIFISIFTIVGSVAGAHAWYCKRIDERVDRRVDSRIEYLHIKFNVIMSEAQKDLAFSMWERYKKERGIE